MNSNVYPSAVISVRGSVFRFKKSMAHPLSRFHLYHLTFDTSLSANEGISFQQEI